MLYVASKTDRFDNLNIIPLAPCISMAAVFTLLARVINQFTNQTQRLQHTALPLGVPGGALTAPENLLHLKHDQRCAVCIDLFFYFQSAVIQQEV